MATENVTYFSKKFSDQKTGVSWFTDNADRVADIHQKNYNAFLKSLKPAESWQTQKTMDSLIEKVRKESDTVYGKDPTALLQQLEARKATYAAYETAADYEANHEKNVAYHQQLLDNDPEALKAEVDALQKRYATALNTDGSRDAYEQRLEEEKQRRIQQLTAENFDNLSAEEIERLAIQQAKSDPRLAVLAAESGANVREDPNVVKSELDKKQYELNKTLMVQQEYRLTEEALASPDFAKKSVYQPSLANGSDKWASLYQEINSAKSGNGTKNVGYMSEAERALFNYHYATGGAAKAEEYLTAIQDTLNARKAGEIFENRFENRVLREIGYGFYAGLDSAITGIGRALGKKKDFYATNTAQHLAGRISEDVGEAGWLPSLAYSVTTGVGQMAPAIAVSTLAAHVPVVGATLAPIAGAAVTGTSTYGNAYAQMINEGYSASQAGTYATLVGVSEAGLEMVMGGIGKLRATKPTGALVKIAEQLDKGLLRSALFLADAAADEFKEEALQELLDPVFKTIATGVDDPRLNDVDWGQVLYAGFVGAITAGVLNGAGNAVTAPITAVRTAVQGKRLINGGLDISALKAAGEALPAETVAHKLASKVTENSGAYTIARLFNEVGAELTQQNRIDIADNLARKGVMTKDAEAIAAYLADVVNGAYLTPKQVKALENNPLIAETVRDVLIDPTSSVNQRTQSFKNSVFPASSEVSLATDGETDSTTTVDDGTGTDTYTPNAEIEQRIRAAESDFSANAPTPWQTADRLLKQQNPQQSAVGVDNRAQNADAARDTGVEIGVRPSEADSTLKMMEASKRQELYASLESHTGAKIVEDATLPFDGEYDPKTQTIRINPNRATPFTVIKHELTHYIESSGVLYQDFMNYALKSETFRLWLESKGKTLQDLRNEITDLYAKNGVKLDEFTSTQEILANFAAEKLFTDIEALRELHTTRPKLFERLRHFIQGLINKIKGVTTDTELERLEQMFAAAVEGTRAKHITIDGWDYKKFSVPKVETSRRLTDADIEEYLHAGGRENKKKQEAYRRGTKIVLTSETEIAEYIGDAISGQVEHTTVAYGKTNERLSADVSAYSKGNISIGDAYLELIPDDLQHAYENHLIAKEEGDIDLSIEDFQNIPKYFDEYDELLYAIRFQNGNTRICVSKVLPNGRLLIIEGVSKSRGSVQFKNAIGVTEEKYNSHYREKYKKGSSVFSEGGSKNPNISSRNTTASPNSINYNGYTVNTYSTQDGTKKFISSQNPLKVAQLKPEDAYGTPPLEENGPINRRSDGESAFADSVQGADIFSDELKQLAAADENVTRYDVVTNKETMRAANRRINTGGRAFVERFMQKDSASYTTDDNAVALILISRYEAAGDHQSALVLMEKLRAAATAQGQAVQVLSLISRLSPDGMAMYAQKELAKAYEEMVKGRSEQWAKEHKEQFNLTDEDIEFIRLRTWQAAQLPKGRDKDIRLAEIASRIQSKIPQAKGQAFKAWQRTAMLLNPKTQLRNVLGNFTMVGAFYASDAIGSVIDRTVAKKTGVRTTFAGLNGAAVKGMKQGFFESYDDFIRHINTRDIKADRFEIDAHSLDNFNEHHTGLAAAARNKMSRALNALDRFNSFLLDAGDRPFYEMWYLHSLNGQMAAAGVSEPTADMIEIATLDALERTWQDTNALTKFLSGLKNGMNHIQFQGYGLGDVVLKFVKTPANLTKAMVEFSPVGLIKAIAVDASRFNLAVKENRVTPQMQRRFVKNMANGIVGTMITFLAAALAAAGAVTGEQDEDKDVAAFERAVLGYQPYSVKIGGMSFSYDWMQPIGAHVAAAANYFQEKENAELTGEKLNLFNTIFSALKAGGRVLFDQSFMQSIHTFMGDDDLITNIINSLLTDINAPIPQLFSQTASALDPVVRNTFESGNDVQTAVNKVLYKIPGARQTLAPSVDVLGNERKQLQNGVARAFTSYVSPFNVGAGYDSAAGEEMYRLYEATGDASAIAPSAPNYVSTSAGKHTLTAHQKAEYQTVMGRTAADAVEKLTQNDLYEGLPDEQKVELLTSIYTYARQAANNQVLGLPLNDSATKAQQAIDSGVPTEWYFLLKKTVDTDGVSGVTQKEARELLDGADLTREQKAAMWKSFNKGWKNNPYGRY